MIFSLTKSFCEKCPRYETCITDTQRKNGRGKKIRMPFHFDLHKETMARMKTDEFREKLKERMRKLDGLFSEAKNQHGLGRARYRGREKMQIQA